MKSIFKELCRVKRETRLSKKELHRVIDELIDFVLDIKNEKKFNQHEKKSS